MAWYQLWVSRALTFGLIDPIGFRRVADISPNDFLALEPEARLLLRPVDDEGNPDRLPTMTGIETRHSNVAIAIGAAAVSEFHHDSCGILQIEHRKTPHLPVDIPWVGIVGEFDVHCPALVEAILDLSRNLLVGEIGQE